MDQTAGVGQIGFAGSWTDATTGLVYMQARDYDPKSSQFLSVDPALTLTHDPYAYVSNNPLAATDPLGLWDINNDFLYPMLTTGVTGEIAKGLVGFGDFASFGLTHLITNAAFPEVDCTITSSGSYFAGGFVGAISVSVATAGLAAGPSGAELVVEATSNAGARFVASSDGVVTDLVGSRNAISIGHFPAYVDNAEVTGARTFSIGDDDWRAMSPTEQWLRNQRFLDDAISRQSDIQLATPLTEMRSGSSFEDEVAYLEAKGYVPSSDGTLMIPGGR